MSTPPPAALGNHVSSPLSAGDLDKSLSHWVVTLPLPQTISQSLWGDRNHVRDMTQVDFPLRCALPIRPWSVAAPFCRRKTFLFFLIFLPCWVTPEYFLAHHFKTSLLTLLAVLDASTDSDGRVEALMRTLTGTSAHRWAQARSGWYGHGQPQPIKRGQAPSLSSRTLAACYSKGPVQCWTYPSEMKVTTTVTMPGEGSPIQGQRLTWTPWRGLPDKDCKAAIFNTPQWPFTNSFGDANGRCFV
jgi:hypothetical protein